MLDFGIAKEEDAARAPRAGAATPVRRAVFGTPYYLAPEQVADHEAAGPASDQYALGVILYECLTGEPPYRGDNVDEVFRAIAAGNPAPPSARRPDIPPELNAVVLRALSPDPKARYFSVAELRQALLPFSSKATGSVPTLQSRAGHASPSPRRRRLRTPSPSPAIEVEVQPPSPFVRTLTPEVEALEGAWFAAGEAPQESAGETAIPSPTARDDEPECGTLRRTVPPVEVESGRAPRRAESGGSFPGGNVDRRRGAAFAVVEPRAGVRGDERARRRAPTPAAALVQIEPAQAAPVRRRRRRLRRQPRSAAPSRRRLPAAPSAAPPRLRPRPRRAQVPAAGGGTGRGADRAAPAPAPSERARAWRRPSPKEARTAATAPAPRERPAPRAGREKGHAAPRRRRPRRRRRATRPPLSAPSRAQVGGQAAGARQRRRSDAQRRSTPRLRMQTQRSQR